MLRHQLPFAVLSLQLVIFDTDVADLAYWAMSTAIHVLHFAVNMSLAAAFRSFAAVLHVAHCAAAVQPAAVVHLFAADLHQTVSAVNSAVDVMTVLAAAQHAVAVKHMADVPVAACSVVVQATLSLAIAAAWETVSAVNSAAAVMTDLVAAEPAQQVIAVEHPADVPVAACSVVEATLSLAVAVARETVFAVD